MGHGRKMKLVKLVLSYPVAYSKSRKGVGANTTHINRVLKRR